MYATRSLLLSLSNSIVKKIINLASYMAQKLLPDPALPQMTTINSEQCF